MSPSPMRGNDLVQEALPDLVKTGHHTTSDSTQAVYFNSTLGYWNRFEMSARQNFQRMNWSRAVLDYAPDQNDNSPNHAYNEQLACGDEHSVVARYNQNVGHVMTSVVRSSSVADIRFGDYKTIKPLPAEFNKVPDFAITDAEAELLIMGEAKTPWVHGIQEPLQSNERLFRKYLGQIARYMYKTKRKFGFWTSYNETVFLKQEKHPTKKGEWVLWHSPVIQHSTSSRRVSSRDPSNPAHYRDKVSLRECFLYLIKMASEEHMAENKMHGDDWVNKTFKAKRDGYISDGSTDSSSEEEVRPSRSQADDRATRYAAREAKKSTTSVSDLEDRASRLTLDDRQRPRKESRWSDFVTDVHYSQSQQKWYYVSKDQRVYVNLHKLEDPHRGTVNYFVQHETYYEVKLKGRR